MDWSKAKNILIISFVFTNIFLAYILFTINKDEDSIKIKDAFVEDVMELLAKESIKVDTKVPKEIPKLPIISVEYEVYDTEKLAKKFLGNYIEEFTNGTSKYRNRNQTIQFSKNNKKVTYKDESLLKDEIKSNITEKDAIEMSKAFITKHGFNLKNAKLNFVLNRDGIYELRYNRVIDGTIVEQTDMKVLVSSKGVILFERYWIKNIEKEKQILKPTSAPKALLRLLAREEYHGKTIKRIDICYYFNIDDYKDDSTLGDSTGGVAVPTWRFILQDGEKVFLEEN